MLLRCQTASAHLLYIPAEIQRHRRGNRAGVRVRCEVETTARSLDTPGHLVGDHRQQRPSDTIASNWKFKECSAICFTETWLDEGTPDDHFLETFNEMLYPRSATATPFLRLVIWVPWVARRVVEWLQSAYWSSLGVWRGFLILGRRWLSALEARSSGVVPERWRLSTRQEFQGATMERQLKQLDFRCSTLFPVNKFSISYTGQMSIV